MCRRRSRNTRWWCRYNDVEAVRAAFAANEGQFAGIIVEPVPGNAGLYLPKPGYLEFLREITAANGALLIFDEVMTGFRLARGGAQERYGITPDLTCFGKIIGGGLPVGAFGGGRRSWIIWRRWDRCIRRAR